MTSPGDPWPFGKLGVLLANLRVSQPSESLAQGWTLLRRSIRGASWESSSPSWGRLSRRPETVPGWDGLESSLGLQIRSPGVWFYGAGIGIVQNANLSARTPV